MPRRFPIVQFPNRPLIVAGLAAAAARLGVGRYTPIARAVADLALLVWAAEELLDGANWFRRLLGLGGGGYALNQLVELASSRAGRACKS